MFEPELDAETRAYVDRMAARAGLALTKAQKTQLYEAAPHALAMAGRIERNHARELAPASVFRFSPIESDGSSDLDRTET